MAAWLDSAISTISPSWALGRFVNREQLKALTKLSTQSRKANLEGIGGDRLQADHTNSNLDIESVTKNNLGSLRNHVRDLELNDGSISGPIENLTNHIVGAGFKFQSKVTADKKYVRLPDFPRIDKQRAEIFNFWMEKRWKKFSKQADLHLLQNLAEMIWTIQAAVLRDGEILVVGRKSTRPDRLIPYCLEILEIDRLQIPFCMITDPDVHNGIRYDADGAPQTYYVLKHHPGSTTVQNWRIDDYEEIPAFNENGTINVMHLFRHIRPEQLRGFSKLISALPEIQNATRYKKAEMFAALQDACGVAIVKTTNPAHFQSNYTKSGNDPNKRINELSPGMTYYLNNFEDMMIRDPKRPNDKFDEIIKAFLRGPANAFNTPPEFFLQDWKDINYSNARTIVIQLYVTIRIQQKALVDHICSVVQENALHDFVAKGLLEAPGFIERKEDYLEASWIPPKREWVDPVKEAQGKMLEIQMGIETPQSICASKGIDFEENLETMAKNLALKKALEKEYKVILPPLFAATNPAEIQEEDKEENENKSEGKNDKDKNKKSMKLLKIHTP